MNLRSALIALDGRVADICLPITNEAALLVFVFHSLFLDDEERQKQILDPQQEITVEQFRRFVQHFKNESYEFVSPAQVVAGLPAAGKFALITFDDGYFNNIRALPALEEFQFPATFFVSTGHITQGKAFWWDVVYREMHKNGHSQRRIQSAIAALKPLRTSEIESKLRSQFGERALDPLGDLDRPFTSAELAEFAQHPLVHLGNHTRDHAILTNYSVDEIREQIDGAQADVREITGKTPACIAYPNGNYSAEIIEMARQAGLRVGVTTIPGKTYLPLPPASDSMKMRRFMLWGNSGIDSQCKVSRSRVSLYRTLQTLKRTPAPASQ